MIVDGNPVHMSFFLCGEHVGTNKFQTYAQDPQGADLFLVEWQATFWLNPAWECHQPPKMTESTNSQCDSNHVRKCRQAIFDGLIITFSDTLLTYPLP